MNIITTVFQQQKAFVAYLTAGQISMNHTVEAALALVDGGVNILEIGVPFSDPIADGPVIQSAMNNALQKKTNLTEVLDCIAAIKEYSKVPIILFSYYNPIFQFELEPFFERANRSGVDGVLIVDLPLEESIEFNNCCNSSKIAPIGIVAPSTSKQRVNEIDSHASGFLYYACRNGITGMRDDLPASYAHKISQIKSVTTTAVVAGFGIAKRVLAQKALEHADGFVVGSAFVNAIEQNISLENLTRFATEIDPRQETPL